MYLGLENTEGHGREGHGRMQVTDPIFGVIWRGRYHPMRTYTKCSKTQQINDTETISGTRDSNQQVRFRNRWHAESHITQRQRLSQATKSCTSQHASMMLNLQTPETQARMMMVVVTMIDGEGVRMKRILRNIVNMMIMNQQNGPMHTCVACFLNVDKSVLLCFQKSSRVVQRLLRTIQPLLRTIQPLLRLLPPTSVNFLHVRWSVS